ncbi:hypothetical protein MJN76_29020, partial [Salmonella enterica subsp. enterica serovar Anatum]|nr:hypothetical protein [Salmonella enterica subsp. enterica serovar Anatum]
IVPLTKGGIIAGSMLVFIPAVGEFVIPELLGGPDSIMIGRVLPGVKGVESAPLTRIFGAGTHGGISSFSRFNQAFLNGVKTLYIS